MSGSREGWRPRGAAGVLALSIWAAPAAGQIPPDPPAEVAEASEIEGEALISMHAGWAEIEVHRAWVNRGPTPHPMLTTLVEPHQAAVVGFGLRLAGDGRRPWEQVGRLLSADDALARFRGVAGQGEAGLLWVDPESEYTRLVVDAVPGRGRADVMYRYLVPTTYRDGRHRCAFAELDGKLRRLAVAPPRGDLTFEGEPAEVVMAREGGLVVGELALDPAQSTPVAGDYARVSLGDGRQLVRYHFAIAPELGEAPRRPHVVLVVDRSTSRHEHHLEMDRLRMLDYLDALPPDASVEVIPFDREARPRFGRFVDLATARAAVASLSLQTKHGSHLDRALAVAAERFAEVPAGADRRLIVLSDARMRDAFSPTMLGVEGALAHAVVTGGPHRGDPDGHPWATAVAETGGLLWHGGDTMVADTEIRLALPAMARLVRPTKLREVELELPGEERDVEERGEVDAGSGIERFDVTEAQLPWVELRGKIWSRSVTLRLRPDPASGRRAAALALAAGFDLTPEQRRSLALRGGALSEHTSFVAAAPGLRAAPPPLHAGGGGRSMSHSHRARAPRVISCGTSIGIDMGEARAQLRMLAEGTLAHCGAPAVAGRRAVLEMETTKSEIVDLEVTGLSKAQRRCAEEALWASELPQIFFAVEHHHWHEDLSM